MKRNRLLLTILAVVMALSIFSFSACDGNNELPNVEQGKDTIVQNVKTAPTETDSKTVVFAAIGKLYSASTFVTTTVGKTVANKGFIEYEQDISGSTVKHGEEFYSCSVSTSAFVNVKHEAFAKGNSIAYRDDDGEIINSSVESYKSVYGITPDKLLSGHVLNQDTVLYAKLNGQKDGLYTYTVVLDKDKANSLLKYQMKAFAGLNGYPQFTSETEMELTVKEDFTPVSISYKSVYGISIPVLGSLECTENCTVTVSKVNEEVSIPDSDKFNAALGTTPSTVEPSPDVTGDEDLEAVIGSILALDVKNGVAFTGSLSVGKYYLPLKVNVKADVDGILKSGNVDVAKAVSVIATTRVNGNELSVVYNGGNLYVDVFGSKHVVKVEQNKSESGVAVDVEAAIKSVVTIAKNSDKQNVYNITFADSIVESIKDSFVSAGIIGDEDELKLGVELYIVNGILGSVTFSADMGETKATAAFAVSNERFELPADLDKYNDKEINNSALIAYFAANVLGLDLDNGISLTGKAAVGNVFVPVKVNAKVDFDALISMEKTAFEATSFTLAVNLGNQEATVIYNDGNFYVSAFGLKYMFVSDIKDVEVDASSVSEMFNFAMDGDVFTFTMVQPLADQITAALIQAGILGEEDKFEFSVKVVAPMLRPSYAVAEVSMGAVEASLETVIVNEKYALPADLSEYGTEIKFGANVKIQLNQQAVDSDEYALGADAAISFVYDTTVTDPVKALKAEVAVTLDDNLKSMLSMAGMFASDLPAWFGVIGEADTLNLVVENGKLYFMAVKVTEEEVVSDTDDEDNENTKTVSVHTPIFVTKIELPETEFDFSGIKDAEIDFSEITGLLGALFEVKLANGVLEAKLSNEIVSLLNMIIGPTLNDLIFENIGTMGVMVMPITGLYRPISYVGLQSVLSEGGLALYIKGYNLEQNEVYVEGKEYEQVDILKISFAGADVSEYKYVHNAAKAVEDDVEAAKVRAVIDEFENFFPVTQEEFDAKKASAVQMYEALTDSQKALVYNYMKGSWTKQPFDSYYASEYTSKKKAADKWATDCGAADRVISKLVNRYNALNDLQKAYIASVYPEVLKTFTAEAILSQTDDVKAWNDAVKAARHTDEEINAMTLADIVAYYNKLVKFEVEQSKFIGDVDGETYTTLKSDISKLTATVADKLVSAAKDYTDELLSMKYGCFKSVQEMLDFYTEVYALYDDIYGGLSNEAKAYLNGYNSKLEGIIVKNQYYLTSGVGFRQGAVSVAQSEIADILQQGAGSEGLEERISKLNELIDLTDTGAIENYEQYLAFVESLKAAA